MEKVGDGLCPSFSIVLTILNREGSKDVAVCGWDERKGSQATLEDRSHAVDKGRESAKRGRRVNIVNMSLQDGRPLSRDVEVEEKVDEEIGTEEHTPLVALAPDVSLPEEQPPACRDVSASPAFLCLDEVSI
ncbi:hypothetical protein Q5P01_003542 [Channa striata]|uniref:Uncharacterized protein n=1 Tax=Channa striata TaxID=64152 RepID=A0AA88NHW5_CHASR|nr:hypothetical protein Q5P01_003542 [Channa striata]